MVRGFIELAAAATLVLAAWPGARLLLDRRFPTLFPRHFFGGVTILAVWLALALYLAIAASHWLVPAAVATAVAVGALWWRGRSAYGSSRGLPPGSLSLSSSVEALLDRGFYLRQVGRYGPVFKMAQFHRGVVCIAGLDRGHRFLRAHEDALGPSKLPFSEDIAGGFLRYMEEATYARYGAIFRRALSRQVVEASAERIREWTRRELAALAQAAARPSSRGAHPVSCFERLVDDAFLWTLFGIGPGSEAHARMGELSRVLSRQDLSRRLTARSRQALEGMTALAAEQVRRLGAAGPEPGHPVCALTELHRLDPSMPDRTCLDNLVFIHRISTSNVVGLLAWITRMLGSHPELLERVRLERDTEESGNSGPPLVDRIILETLRLAQSEYLYRLAREDLEVEGFRVPKGWWVRLCVWESHRDGENFPDPETFDPGRFLTAAPAQGAYSPFGAHRHACNGVPLTMVLCRSVVHELARGQWHIADDGQLARDFRHWSHWRPGPGLLLMPRGDTASPSPT